ncbi:MAG: hypothetical protein ACREPG_05675 [Candidatus Binatia bacterium]
MPLLEKVRIELFIPDLPGLIYARILEEIGNELSYAFGGCTAISTQGKYRSTAGLILPDKVNILITDTPFQWDKDRLLIERYTRSLHQVVRQVLSSEEAILISVHPVYHIE